MADDHGAEKFWTFCRALPVALPFVLPAMLPAEAWEGSRDGRAQAFAVRPETRGMIPLFDFPAIEFADAGILRI